MLQTLIAIAASGLQLPLRPVVRSISTHDAAHRPVPLIMSEPEAEPPQSGFGFKDTMQRLRAGFESGKETGAAWLDKKSTPQAEAAQEGSNSVGAVLISALLAAVQVEIAQFFVVFCGAWLFGVGVPVATIAPATGVRLRTAAAMALASRHPMRVGRLLLQALFFPMVLRGLRRSAAPREYLQDQSAQPLAVLATAIFTARALERTLGERLLSAPALLLLDKCGLTEATERTVASVTANAQAAWSTFARAEELALTNPASGLLVRLTELDAWVFALLTRAWVAARPWVMRLKELLFP